MASQISQVERISLAEVMGMPLSFGLLFNHHLQATAMERVENKAEWRSAFLKAIYAQAVR